MSYGKIDPKIDGQVSRLRSTVAQDLDEHRRTIDRLTVSLSNTLLELVELKRRVEALEQRHAVEVGEVSG